jgi:hypothetical protein
MWETLEDLTLHLLLDSATVWWTSFLGSILSFFFWVKWDICLGTISSTRNKVVFAEIRKAGGKRAYHVQEGVVSQKYGPFSHRRKGTRQVQNGSIIALISFRCECQGSWASGSILLKNRLRQESTNLDYPYRELFLFFLVLWSLLFVHVYT